MKRISNNSSFWFQEKLQQQHSNKCYYTQKTSKPEKIRMIRIFIFSILFILLVFTYYIMTIDRYDMKKVDNSMIIIPIQQQQYNNNRSFNNDLISIEKNNTILLFNSKRIKQQKQQFHNNNYNSNIQQRNIIFYSYARYDRSGAFIQDMLMAHAYCYNHNYTYGGSCLKTNNISTDYPYLYDNIQMIYKLHLHHILNVLSYNCMTLISYNNSNDNDNNQQQHLQQQQSITTTSRILSSNIYQSHELSKYWNNRWINYIVKQLQQQQSIRQQNDIINNDLLEIQQPIENNNSNNTNNDTVMNSSTMRKRLQVMVHIRRGDVTVCNESLQSRYLPNEYYINILKEYNYIDPFTYDITIYSETSNSIDNRIQLESWDDFLSLSSNIRIELDTKNIYTIWYNMIYNANVLIMSKSSFSIIPALLLTGLSNYTAIIHIPGHQFWYNTLPYWIVMNDTNTWKYIDEIKRQLYDEKCNNIINNETTITNQHLDE